MKRIRHSRVEVEAHKHVAPLAKKYGIKVLRKVVQRCAVELTISRLERRAKNALRSLRAQKERL